MSGMMTDAQLEAVLAHLCGEPHHGFGDTTELCESRHDCVVVVTCRVCGRTFALDDDQYDALVRWSERQGQALACGVYPLA